MPKPPALVYESKVGLTDDLERGFLAAPRVDLPGFTINMDSSFETETFKDFTWVREAAFVSREKATSVDVFYIPPAGTPGQTHALLDACPSRLTLLQKSDDLFFFALCLIRSTSR